MNATRRRRLSLLLGLGLWSCTWCACAADVLAAAKARGSLTVAMEGTYPPFNFKDPKTGELFGYDVDVAKLVAARLGLKAQFVTTEWSAILAGLAANKYDVIISQVGITPKRLEAFDFSEPYTYSCPQLILRADDRASYPSLNALKGKTVGVGQGTVFEQQAKAVPGITVRSYPATPENLQDLANGRIDAALNDSLMVAYLLSHSPLPLKAGPRVGSIERMGIALAKGNPALRDALNSALAGAARDGSLRKLALKWFGSDISRPAP